MHTRAHMHTSHTHTHKSEENDYEEKNNFIFREDVCVCVLLRGGTRSSETVKEETMND